MSERKKLTGRAIECYLCGRVGLHSQMLTSKGLKFLCKFCQVLVAKAGI